VLFHHAEDVTQKHHQNVILKCRCVLFHRAEDVTRVRNLVSGTFGGKKGRRGKANRKGGGGGGTSSVDRDLQARIRSAAVWLWFVFSSRGGVHFGVSRVVSSSFAPRHASRASRCRRRRWVFAPPAEV